jgi:hypothetical protein
MSPRRHSADLRGRRHDLGCSRHKWSWVSRQPVQTIVSLPHSGASHLSTWQVVRWLGRFGSRRSSIRSSLPWPHHLQLDRLSWVDSLAATASSFPTTLIVVARRDALNGYKVDLARMEGCNH